MEQEWKMFKKAVADAQRRGAVLVHQEKKPVTVLDKAVSDYKKAAEERARIERFLR